MTKIIVIIIVLIVAAAGAYYLLGGKTSSGLVPTKYNSTSSAQPSSDVKGLESEAEAINLSTDNTSDLDLIAVDEDIKGL